MKTYHTGPVPTTLLPAHIHAPCSSPTWQNYPTLQRLKWSEVAQSCPTLCDPTDCSLPLSSIHGIFQAGVLEWVAISFSKGSSRPRDQTQVSHIVGRRFYHLSRQCVKSLIAVFQKHAGRDGNNSKLSKAEFMIFMNSELGAFTKVVVPAPNPRLQDQDRRLAQNEWQQLSPQGWVSSEWLLSIFSSPSFE